MAVENTDNLVVENSDKITCHICDARVHVMTNHLKNEHETVTPEQYQDTYPGAPMLSQTAMKLKERKRSEDVVPTEVTTKPTNLTYEFNYQVGKMIFHEAFGFGPVKAALSTKNASPIQIEKIEAPELLIDFVPERDSNYQFGIEPTKLVVMSFALRKNLYLYGHFGTGKTTLIEQVCAVTGRPLLRVQHTRNMEESHVLGQWVVREGQTVFELGPLAYCMKHGLVYLADEYDFAMPAVLALYQPVLEGKALVIKEADHANRVIKPHPLFRFCATGNTNGTGDDTGLYQGTMLQNAANYERFGIVEEVTWMEKSLEQQVVAAQGGIPLAEAEKLVDFAKLIREGFANGKIGLPISPRALINAAQYGSRVSSFRKGLEKAFLNRLNRIDKEIANEILNKIGKIV